MIANTNLKIKLNEGNFYTFLVTGRIILPDNTEQFVLVDPNGIRHLIDAEPYDRYSLLRRKEISCRVDKINCSGKIYLEPEHPVCKIGEIYPFEFAGYKKEKNRAVFKDPLGYYTSVPYDTVPNTLHPGENLDCTVLRIKRGRVYISRSVATENYDEYTVEKNYSFTITGEVESWEKYEFYIIKDISNDRIFNLRKKFYRKYGFKTGFEIICTLKQEETNYYFEPQHPRYHIGQEYSFDIVKEEDITEYPNLKKPAYFLRNDFGKEIIIKKEDVQPNEINQNTIYRKVIDIRKSQIFI